MGVSDEHLGPATVDLSELHFLVVGPYRSGRSTALATIAQARVKRIRKAALHLLAPRRSPLRELDLWSDVATGADACAELAGTLLERLRGRRAASTVARRCCSSTTAGSSPTLCPSHGWSGSSGSRGTAA